ncbi:MAG: Rho-binding antiterminator [Polaribacter sp.]|jgi:Rho-binding antiterminator
MKKEKTDYKPIDCNLYDEVVLLIMRKQKIKIDYQNEAGKDLEAETILKDVFAKEGEEFILLENGERVRLDRLSKIDGREFEGYCGV